MFHTAVELDDIDRQILGMLVENARIPLKDISARVFLTTPAVAARIQRLERNGVLTGFHAKLNLTKLGYIVRAFINVSISPGQKKAFTEKIIRHRNVLECHSVTGDYSVVLQAAFHDTAELDMFVGELQQYGRTNTQIVFSSPLEHREDVEI